MQPVFDPLRSVLDRMLQGAFPDDGHAPAKSMEHFYVARIAIDILLEFLPPELSVCLGSRRVATAFVSVPETSVDENNRPVLGEHKVGGAGKIFYMKSISKPSGEKKGTKCSFRPGVLPSDARHHATALRGGRDAHGLEDIPLGYMQKQSSRITDK